MTTRVYTRHIDILNRFAPELTGCPLHKAAPSDAIPELPPNMSTFSGQIAGHKMGVRNGEFEFGFMKDQRHPDRLLKPAQRGVRGNCEINFYESIFSPSGPAAMRIFRSLLPHYHGTRYLPMKGIELNVMEMEDLSASFVCPATIDIKIGRQTFGPDASAAKAAKERKKYPHQAEIGFRLLGYTVSNKPELNRDRAWGFTVQPDQIQCALSAFLSTRGPDAARSMLLSLLARLDLIRTAMASGLVHIYSSSLLICYEASPSLPPKIDVRMIDFSHVFDGQGEMDHNYVYGIDQLRKHLQNILADLGS